MAFQETALAWLPGALGSPFRGDGEERARNNRGGREMPTWRAGVRARDGRCTRGRERALLLGCGPRTTLAPQGCPGQDQTSQGGLERLVGQTLALLEGNQRGG